jgi:cell wall-associated NlpC family hydrolase
MALSLHRIGQTHPYILRMNLLKTATAAVFLCFVAGSSASAATIQQPGTPGTHNNRHRHVQNARVTREHARLVTSGTKAIRERLVQLSTAIDDTELDCSHFANYVYERVGFTYDYAPSAQLYKGAAPFVRVQHAQPGDLIVWRGHVGIVVDPAEHTFVSKLNSGVKVASWDTHYWKRRGYARFFRFTGKLQPAPDPEIANDIRDAGNAFGASD